MADFRPRNCVIIPNWNGADHLVDCLNSLAAQTLKPDRVVVVDNGSSDNSLALLADRFGWVEVIETGANLGFSAAVNAGIRATDSELIVLLNNDTRAEPQWLERLVSGMQRYPEASFGACKMLLSEPPHLIDSAGDGYSLLTGAGINIGAGESRDSHDQFAWVFGACAGAAIYRRELFDDIGLFDEDFFLVFEDIDLDLRAQVAGHRCLYIPDAIVYHKRGASTDSASLEVIVRSWRNHIWVAGKNLPPALLAWWTVVFCLRAGRLAMRSTLIRGYRKLRPEAGARTGGREQARSSRKGILTRHYWPALRSALAGLPGKRRAVRPLRRHGTIRLLPQLSCRHRPISEVSNDVRR